MFVHTTESEQDERESFRPFVLSCLVPVSVGLVYYIIYARRSRVGTYMHATTEGLTPEQDDHQIVFVEVDNLQYTYIYTIYRTSGEGAPTGV